MYKIETSTGFVCEIDEGIRDDFELLENLIRLDEGEYTALPAVLDSIIGDGKKALYEHCRGENGRVSTQAVMREIKEIFDNAGKNLKN